MNIQPCPGCILKPTCSQRHALSKLLRKRNIASARIDCKEWERIYSPGVRVSVVLQECEDNSGNWFEGGLVTGTICGKRRKTQLIVWIDDEYLEKDICHQTRVKMIPSRITFLSEPPVGACPDCGTPEGKAITYGWGCNRVHVREAK